MSELLQQYKALEEKHLNKIGENLEAHIAELFSGTPRIDRISARVKDADKFIKKSEKKNDDGSDKYEDPLGQIQDIIGVRIIAFYKPDVVQISKVIEAHFTRIEEREVSPESEYEFGYFGKHFVLLLPSDVLPEHPDDDVPQVFELQVKTLFQHAWSEATHDLDYKEEHEPLSIDDKRKIAFASAQAWGADNAFEDVASRKILDFKQRA